MKHHPLPDSFERLRRELKVDGDFALGEFIGALQSIDQSFAEEITFPSIVKSERESSDISASRVLDEERDTTPCGSCAFTTKIISIAANRQSICEVNYLKHCTKPPRTFWLSGKFLIFTF
jgi:hypothetical protein